MRIACALCTLLVRGALGAAGSAGGIADRISSLSFAATSAPQHLTTIGVGVYFEHLFEVDSEHHTFKADFWLVYKWHDDRDYSPLFVDNPDIEIEETICPSSSGSSGHRQLSETASSAASSSAASSADVISGSIASAHGTRRYLEFGHAAYDLIWHPDLHIRNERRAPKLHAELTRLYEDGTIEHMAFIFNELELYHPYYGSYPFDHQYLTVQVESLAHTTKQIDIEPLALFSGLNMALTSEWPGWTPSDGGVHFSVERLSPDYALAPGNEHRCEKRARYHLDVEVQRVVDSIVESAFIPLFIQVALTWSAFYINIRVLMPRVAVAFISYLTLSNTANALASGLPAVSYTMWLSDFILLQRLMVIIGLIETAANFFVTERLSTRVGSSLDKFARYFVPFNYLFINVIFVTVGSDAYADKADYEGSLLALKGLMWANFALALLAGALCIAWSYYSLRKLLREDPMRAHRAALHKPLDSNEVSYLFQALDLDASGILTLEELAEGIISRTAGGKLKPYIGSLTPAVLEHLKGKPGMREKIDLQVFQMQFKPIMAELSLMCVQCLLDHGMNAHGEPLPSHAAGGGAAASSTSDIDVIEVKAGA